MITIIRYRNDSYYALDGKIEYPSTMHSGYIDEERELQAWHRKKLIAYEDLLNKATYLNKVHVKAKLEKVMPNWREKFTQELNFQKNQPHIDRVYMNDYTLYYLENVTINDLIQPTNI